MCGQLLHFNNTICMSIWPNGAHTCAKEGLHHISEENVVSVHEIVLPPRAVCVVPTAAAASARRGEARVWPCCCSDVRRVVAGSEVRLVARGSAPSCGSQACRQGTRRDGPNNCGHLVGVLPSCGSSAVGGLGQGVRLGFGCGVRLEGARPLPP